MFQVTAGRRHAGWPHHLAIRGQRESHLHQRQQNPALTLGSHTTVDGIEFECSAEHPRGAAISVPAREHVTIQNCRCFAFQGGIERDDLPVLRLSITNCEMAYSGAYGIHIGGSGDGPKGHWDPADVCRDIEIRNCYLHDAGWNTAGTEGYGFTANGAVEHLTIENCQIDNNSGDGILDEDGGIHTTAVQHHSRVGDLKTLAFRDCVATEEQIPEWDKHPELRRNQPRTPRVSPG